MNKVFPIVFCSLLFGCNEKEETEETEDSGLIACTSEIVSSVYVTIYDENGEVIENAAPTYSVDGGPEGSCEEDSIGGHHCGEEQAGTVTIHVSVEGYEDAEQSVVVESNECHVITEEMDIRLVPAD